MTAQMRPVAMRHILEHGPMLRALGRTAVRALRGAPAAAAPEVPGPWRQAEVRPPSAALVQSFVAATGGEPASYRGALPPQLFPQWTLATASQVLASAPYPLARVVNAGCRLEVRGRIAAGEPLIVRARLAAIDESDARVVLTTQIETGTRGAPDAVFAELRALVPRGDGERKAKAKAKDRGQTPEVARDARELARAALGGRAGLEFAKLTGDFNPIHWLRPYARSAGFRGCILHGFGTLAIASSALVSRLLSGDASKLRVVEARFTRPLLLPARVAVYVTPAGELFVGDAPGGAAYLVGRYQIGAAP